jgi:hypothetical protein
MLPPDPSFLLLLHRVRRSTPALRSFSGIQYTSACLEIEADLAANRREHLIEQTSNGQIAFMRQACHDPWLRYHSARRKQKNKTPPSGVTT